jgi:hypothetical protein
MAGELFLRVVDMNACTRKQVSEKLDNGWVLCQRLPFLSGGIHAAPPALRSDQTGE